MSSPLSSYLKRVGVGDAEFGERIGRDRTMVSRLRRGLLKPTLNLAAAIERETSGQVSMRAWVEPAPQTVEAA